MEGPSLSTSISKVYDFATQNPHEINVVITELSYLLNRYDPDIRSKKRPEYRLIEEDFNPDAMFQQIRDACGDPNLRIPQIRIIADELSQSKRIPLPTATRNHKEALLQWFHDHWAILNDEIPQANYTLNRKEGRPGKLNETN
jgi:hypothetical protein